MSSTLIQSGLVPKKAPGPYSVTFPTAFSKAPVVALTPFWSSQRLEVGKIETLIDVTATGFTATSSNAAPTYEVAWIAFGNAG